MESSLGSVNKCLHPSFISFPDELGTANHANKIFLFPHSITCGATKAPVMYRVDGTGAVNIKVEGQNAEVYTLKAEIGKAPQKIRVETRYEWTAERQDINDKYPGFADWVAE